MARYRAGIIGCGRVARAHARGYRATAPVDLIAAADIVPATLQTFAEEWGIAAPYADYRQMLERERLDIVSVCTRNHQHVAPTIAAADAGARAIFCEKPMALTLGEADAMLAACDRAGALLCIDHTMRFEANYLALKEQLAGGLIGDVLTLTVLALGDLGELTNDATNGFDTLRMFNGDAAWIFAHLERRVEKRDDREDLYATVAHRNGARGVLIYGGYSDFRYEGFVWEGSRGRLEATSHRGWEPLLRLWRFDGGPPASFRDGHALATAPNDPWVRAIGELVDCLQKEMPCRSDGCDGRAALELTLACYEAKRRGDAKIVLPLLMTESPLDLALAEGTLASIWARGLQRMS